MAIKISNLDQISDQFKQKDFYFKDLHFDIEGDGPYSAILHKKTVGNDIKVDYDESAIRNSLRNLFNTRPGQRFLFPTYGLDLSMYVFEPVTESLGKVIGNKIATCIKTFEPRVKLQQCNVVAKPDDNEYDITVIVEIPIFTSVASINTILDPRSQSFVFVENSRNR